MGKNRRSSGAVNYDLRTSCGIQLTTQRSRLRPQSWLAPFATPTLGRIEVALPKSGTSGRHSAMPHSGPIDGLHSEPLLDARRFRVSDGVNDIGILFNGTLPVNRWIRRIRYTMAAALTVLTLQG